jgi:SNF2 family DNA or RNA helicase
VIERPLKKGNERGIALLKILVKEVVLRRTKAMKINSKLIVDLPECVVYLHKIPFSESERRRYQVVEGACKENVQQILQSNVCLIAS